MIVNTDALAVPYLFDENETKDLHTIMTNSLVQAYIQSMRLVIMMEREQAQPTEGSFADRAAEIVVADAEVNAKLELLDSLEQVPNVLAHQLKQLAKKRKRQPQS